MSEKFEVIEALGGLCEVAASVGARSLADRLDRDVVRKLEADRFHLVVVGEFNHGKTTFVNALLGRPVLPIGVTPTTAVIHHIVFSESPASRAWSTPTAASASSLSIKCERSLPAARNRARACAIWRSAIRRSSCASASCSSTRQA